MVPKKDEKADPRSSMTDRNRFMTRSLHTPRIVSIVAADIAKRQSVSGPKDAVKRALRMLEMPDDYDADRDPTMAKCIELTAKLMK